MSDLNRRTFLGLTAASAGAVLIGATGCAEFSGAGGDAPADNASLLFSEIAVKADDAAAAPIENEAMLTAQISQAALRFLDGLDEPQREQSAYAFSDSERFRWHWTSPSNFPRNGLPLREMTEAQKLNAFSLLATSLSSVGLEKALNIMSLQQDLGNDPELYYVTIFGTPGTAAPWGWRWEGHHLSHSFTVVGNTLATTPFFLGAWPTNTEAGLRAMPREEDAGLELVNSFDGGALDVALFSSQSLRQHVTQNAASVTPLEPTGLLYADMNDRQQALVEEIIQTYQKTQPELIANPNLARITETGLEEIRFAWAGSMEYRNPQYYRLQGPTFLLEFDNSRGGGTHIHSVWRDFGRDFGANLL